MRTGTARLVAVIVGAGALAVGSAVTASWRSGPSYTVYSGSYAPLQGVNMTQADAEPLTTTIQQAAFPGWLAIGLALAALLLALPTPMRPLPLAAAAAAASAAALATAPGLEMPLGSALIRIAVVLVPALAALVVLRLAVGAGPRPESDDPTAS